jgi:hypothetical protein
MTKFTEPCRTRVHRNGSSALFECTANSISHIDFFSLYRWKAVSFSSTFSQRENNEANPGKTFSERTHVPEHADTGLLGQNLAMLRAVHANQPEYKIAGINHKYDSKSTGRETKTVNARKGNHTFRL